MKELTKSNKTMAQENKIFAENFHSERILRKKYYNMVEDMKGKIRVYCRSRPLSRSELDRGNYNIISSPDEYTLVVQAGTWFLLNHHQLLIQPFWAMYLGKKEVGRK